MHLKLNITRSANLDSIFNDKLGQGNSVVRMIAPISLNRTWQYQLIGSLQISVAEGCRGFNQVAVSTVGIILDPNDSQTIVKAVAEASPK